MPEIRMWDAALADMVREAALEVLKLKLGSSEAADEALKLAVRVVMAIKKSGIYVAPDAVAAVVLTKVFGEPVAGVLLRNGYVVEVKLWRWSAVVMGPGVELGLAAPLPDDLIKVLEGGE